MRNNKIQMPSHLISRTLDCHCRHCGRLCWYSGYSQSQDFWGWDAEFCKVCDSWMNDGKGCGDPNCSYCCARPKRPSLIQLQETVWQGHCWNNTDPQPPILPLSGKEGQMGAARVSLPFGPSAREVRIGMAIVQGPDWWDEYQSRLLVFGLGEALAVTDLAGCQVSAPGIDEVATVAAGTEFYVFLGPDAVNRCRLSFDGVFVWLEPQTADGQRQLLLSDSDIASLQRR